MTICETFRSDREMLFGLTNGAFYPSRELEIAIATDAMMSKMTMGVVAKDQQMKDAKMMDVVLKIATMIGVLSVIAMSRDERMNSVANR